MQLWFDDPLAVSQYTSDPELLQIKFYGYYLFFDTDGLMLEKDTIVTKRLPSQMILGGLI